MSSEPWPRRRPGVWPGSSPGELRLICRGSPVPQGTCWYSALGPGPSVGCFLFGGACLPAAGVPPQGELWVVPGRRCVKG